MQNHLVVRLMHLQNLSCLRSYDAEHSQRWFIYVYYNVGVSDCYSFRGFRAPKYSAGGGGGVPELLTSLMNLLQAGCALHVAFVLCRVEPGVETAFLGTRSGLMRVVRYTGVETRVAK